jgi:hypothetical protein
MPVVQARSGWPASSERSVLAPQYAGASTMTGALDAGSAKAADPAE